MKPNNPEFKRPNVDSLAWAKYFVETNPMADVDTMNAWFANAMMDMHDHVHRTTVRQLEQQMAELINKQPTRQDETEDREFKLWLNYGNAVCEMEDDRELPSKLDYDNMFNKQPIQQQETDMETKQTNTAGAQDESIAVVRDTPTGVQRERTLEVVARRQWPSTSTGTIERLCFEDYQTCHYQDGMFWVYFGERRCRTFRQEDVFSFEAFPASEGRYQGLKAQEDEEAKRGEVSLEAGGDLKIGRTGNTVTYHYANKGVLVARPEGEDESDTNPVPQGGAQPKPLTREESIQILRAFDINNPRVHEAIGILTREPQLDPPLDKTIWLWDNFLQGWYLGVLIKPGKKVWLPYDAIEQPKEQQ